MKAIGLKDMTEQMLVRLRREIQVLRSLHNPNIIALREIFEEHGFLYMVMELATGGELWHFLQRVEVKNRTRPPIHLPTPAHGHQSINLPTCALLIFLYPMAKFADECLFLLPQIHSNGKKYYQTAKGRVALTEGRIAQIMRQIVDVLIPPHPQKK